MGPARAGGRAAAPVPSGGVEPAGGPGAALRWPATRWCAQVLDAAVDSTGASAGGCSRSPVRACKRSPSPASRSGDALVGAHVALGAGTAGYVANLGQPARAVRCVG